MMTALHARHRAGEGRISVSGHQGNDGRLRRVVRSCAAGALVAGVLVTGGVARAADAADEIHYSFGSTADSVVFDWRGGDSTIYYGPDSGYGLQATASAPAVTPVDDPGPFREVALAGLTPGTTYHYKIGAAGDDHTFTTTPTGDFTWADLGDTGTTLCQPWMTQEHALVAAQSPSFVTHGGDISYANECGVAAVHQYFVDQQAWSEDAAFMPVWGNHEYGPPSSTAPPGTPRDTLANYKGRVAIPHPQTVPNDTATKTSNPGCGAEIGSATNTCLGEDWGWFVAGHVLFISYPEPWSTAYAAWEPVAQSLMASAQADPSIDFVVTYGHRPAYSSQSGSAVTDLRTALTTLSGLYSPTPANPYGKYVLNVSHHVHAEEVFAPIGGLVNITNGSGGSGQVTLSTPAAGSIFRMTHPAILSAGYDATAHTLSVSLLCGPAYAPNPKSSCTYGSAIYSQTFTRPDGTPPPAPSAALQAGLDDGVTAPVVGQSVTYTVTAGNPVAGSTASGVTAAVVLPAGYSITDAGGGTVGGSSVSWVLGDVAGGTSVVRSVTATLSSGSPGDSLVATAQVQDVGGACANAASSCSAGDTDTVADAGGVRQWVANQSVETDLTGWTGVWNAASVVTRATTDGFDGQASVQVGLRSGAGTAGVNSKPKPVTSTVAGTPYTASVQVKGSAVGEVIVLFIRETTAGGAGVGSRSVSVRVPDTGWHPLQVVYPAARSGDQLTFSVYSGNLPSGGWFRADLMSLTSPDGTPPPAPSAALQAGLDDGVTAPVVGQSVTYTVTAGNPVAGSTASGVTAAVVLPAGYSITDAGGGTVGGSSVSWVLGDVAGGTSVVRSVTATLSSGSPGDSLVATAQVQDVGGACANAASSCSAGDTDTVADAGGVRQWVANQSVETDLTGWTGVWNAASVVTRATTDGFDGQASVQVGLRSGAGTAGVNSKPKPVTSTVAGTPYTASVQVKGSAVGEVIVLFIRETTAGGAGVGSRSVSVRVPDTGWHPLQVVYPAARSGDQLTFSVYSGNLPSGGWFRADLMSLTSP